jgi:6-phosphofructokinase 2
MVYTITLNPALDRTLWVEKIQPDDSNRIEREERYAGGKGIDVSKVLTTLEVRNYALGFIGGFAGEEVEGRMLNEGISCDFIRISGETRTNIVVNDMSNRKQTVFSASGPEIRPYELMRIIHKVEKLERPHIVVISGSLPPGIHPEIYRKLVAIAKDKGARVILDTDGNALKVGVQGLPEVIKPNIHELSRLVGTELKGIDAITRAAVNVHKQGVKIVLVSMGAKGILLVSKSKRYLASPPTVKVKNTIGAGDSAVAGFVYGLVKGRSLREALINSVAAGTATTLRPGTALCQKKDFMQLIKKVKVYSI